MTAFRFLDSVRIGHPNGYGYVHLRPVVDITADHAMAPACLLKELGAPELEQQRLLLADGTVAEYGVGTACFEIAGRTRPCLVSGRPRRYLSARGFDTVDFQLGLRLGQQPPGTSAKPDYRKGRQQRHPPERARPSSPYSGGSTRRLPHLVALFRRRSRRSRPVPPRWARRVQSMGQSQVLRIGRI